MLDQLRERAWKQINVTFPERQIYIRSDGRVQFFTFDPMMQAVFAAGGILLLGWVAFSSVNVIFKDRIIEAKERHFVEMQSAYENRLADLQISYDELNGALATAEDRFASVADAFEVKQRALAALIGHKEELHASLAGTAPLASAAVPAKSAALNGASEARPRYLGMNLGMGGVLNQLLPDFTSSLSPAAPTALEPLRGVSPFNAAIVPSLPESSGPAPTADRQTFLRGAVRRIGELFSRKVSSSELDNPSLRHIAEARSRVAQLGEEQPVLLAEARQDFDKETARLTRILKNTGVDPKTFVARERAQDVGGPLIEIGPNQIATPDPRFNDGVAGAIDSLAALSDVVSSLRAVPLTTPLPDPELSSGFGARTDPFTENLAFHTGLDFSGEKGTDIHVTAPGVVVYAARNGAYGNMVEVDHGNRFRTRYAHLSKILVPVGARLKKGDVVGELGSTGRSTGPHVHYEIWYNNVVKDPGRFIRAGKDVLKD